MRIQPSLYLLLCLSSASVIADEQFTLSDEADRTNYTIGHQIGTDYRKQKVELDEEALRLGLQQGQDGIAPMVDKAEMEEMLLDLKRNITSKLKKEAIAKIQERERMENEIRAKGEAFRKEFQTRDGVKTLPGGVEYRVIKQGYGPKPELSDYVTIEYEARTEEGFLYDSSAKKGGPVTLRADKVIPGFTKVIQIMQPGDKWEVVIPPEQAYGRQGPLAHHTIVLNLELLSISNKPPERKYIDKAAEKEDK